MAELTVRHTVLTASLDADPTVREYVTQQLSTDLMKSVRMATCFNGEIIVSMGPIKEIQVKDLCSVRFEQSMSLTPLVRCKDCRYRDPEDKKCDSGALERAGCLFPVDDDYFCADGERK